MTKRAFWVIGAIMAGMVCVGVPVVSRAQSPFAKVPTGQEFMRYYPQRAMTAGLEGRATLDCVVGDDGLLSGCTVLSEDPKGWEFGDAALKMSAFFRMKDHVGVKHAVIPINFALETTEQRQRRLALSQLRWAREPEADDLQRSRPPSFAGAATVTMRCHVRSTPDSERGKLFGCQPVKEEPSKAGSPKRP
jgi:TonB family protein